MQQDIKDRIDAEIVPDAPTDPDEFLRWSSQRPREEGKYELSRGRVYRSMPNVTRLHNRICKNLTATLDRLLDAETYDVGGAEFGIRTPFGVRNPDAYVSPYGQQGKALSTDDAVFVAEVLSESTERLDRGQKRIEYMAIPTLRMYVLFAQDEPMAWVYARRENGSWPDEADVVKGRGASIPIKELAVVLEMAAVYRAIPDLPDAATA